MRPGGLTEPCDISRDSVLESVAGLIVTSMYVISLLQLYMKVHAAPLNSIGELILRVFDQTISQKRFYIQCMMVDGTVS